MLPGAGRRADRYALGLVAAASSSPELGWRERIDLALEAYLRTCAATPGLTRSYLLELFGMGDRGWPTGGRRCVVGAELCDLVEDCRRELRAQPDVPGSRRPRSSAASGSCRC